jgi:phosphotransferase system HPr (HPr) family protein
MCEVTLVVRHSAGLHARPAALFVQTAAQFASHIQVAHGERQANAKSILGVLALGVSQGMAIHIRAEGEDASLAVAALASLVESNFGEGA